MTKQELVYCNYDSKHNNLLTLKPKRTLGEAKCYTSEIKLNTMLASDRTWYMYLQLIQALSSLTKTHYFVYDELNHAYIYCCLLLIYWRTDTYMTSPLTTFCFLSNKTNRFFIPVGLFKSWINNISDTISWASCATFCFYHILTWSVIYCMTDTWQHGTYMYLLHKKLH